MIQSRSTKFTLAFVTAAALLAVIGAVVALPDSAEAGRKPLYITSVDMTLTPTAEATRDNKVVDISFTWGAPSRATGYKIDRRHRVDIAESLPGQAEWSKWVKAKYISTTERRATINETYTFYRAGTQIEWRIKLRDKKGKWGPPIYVTVSWGLKKTDLYHYVIKSAWFYD